MIGLSNLESWLSDSIKNRHYFYSAISRAGYHAEWIDAYETLQSRLPYVVTREDYFHWRSVWRAAYKKLSDESRLMKGLRRPPFFGTPPDKHGNMRASTVFIADWNVSGVLSLREIAGRMLALRAESFEHADEQYKIAQSMLEAV